MSAAARFRQPWAHFQVRRQCALFVVERFSPMPYLQIIRSASFICWLYMMTYHHIIESLQQEGLQS